MGFIEVLNYFLALAVGGFIGYYFLISVLAFLGNRKIDYGTVKTRKFAVLLYTHGREQILSRSLYSVSGLVYPKNKYDLIVIADSYSDSIVQVGEKMGAKILVPPIDRLGENPNSILSWAFKRILKEKAAYDAVVIFDSDGLVSGNYLEVMNYYLEQGCEIIQGGFKNLSNANNWGDKIREVDFLFDKYVYPMGRKVMDLGTNIRSNGICFSTSLLHEFPWKTKKQPSFIEYGIELRLNGIEVDFASSATVFTKLFQAHKDKEIHNSNDNPSNYLLIRNYVARFLRAIAKTKSFKYVDMLLELITPKFNNLMFFAGAMAVLNSVFLGVGWVALSALLLWLLIIGIAITGLYVSMTVVGVGQKFLRSIMYIPISISIKIKALVENFSRKEKAIVKPDKKSKYIAVSDENQPVQ